MIAILSKWAKFLPNLADLTWLAIKRSLILKIAMIILGVIGSLIALGGSIVTIIGGFGGTAVGTLAENSATAMSGGVVFWSGVLAFILSALALVSTVVGGAAKRMSVILSFSLATLMLGMLNVYLYNWVSGSFIAVAGVLGMVGAKEGTDGDQDITKSPLFYFVLVVIAILIGAAVVIKNGSSVIEYDKKNSVEKTNGFPFTGKRGFNFEGGSGTEKSVEIKSDGQTKIEMHGASIMVLYEGTFSNPLKFPDGSGLLFKDNKVYRVTNNVVEKGCKIEGEDCVSDLYVINAAPPVQPAQNIVPEQNAVSDLDTIPEQAMASTLNLKLALEDSNAIVCRFNEAEDLCSDVSDKNSIPANPVDFAAARGYKKIFLSEIFDEPGTSETYMKITVLAPFHTLPVSENAGTNPDKTDMSGQKLQGKLVNARCLEANAEMLVKTSTQQLWLQCQSDASICNEICFNDKKDILKRYTGKTLNITLGKSEKWPPKYNYSHFVDKIVIQ